MLITSATTVNTVRYLSIQELEQYKKQFQSFWIPFMEQFIPATTIWVAGERWCNEPCDVIKPCDYDFEFVAEESSISTIKGVNTQPKRTGGYKSNVTTSVKSNISLDVSKSLVERVTKTPLVTTVQDLGVTTTTNMVVNNYNFNAAEYRNKFTQTEIETI